jgi:hypothetical protein
MERKWFVWFSAFGFFIYALHVPMVNYCTALAFHYFHGITHYRLLIYFVVPSLVILFCVATGALLRLIVPKVYSLATGGRGL